MPDDLIDSENWVGMRVGETRRVLGALRRFNVDRVDAHGRVPTITIGFPDWSTLVVAVPGGVPHELVTLHNNTGFEYVNVSVRRTEDGLEGIAIWAHPGGVPIPLSKAETVRSPDAQQRTTVS